jgi:hypothetical protein
MYQPAKEKKKKGSSAAGIRDRLASFIGRIHQPKKPIDRITLVCRCGHSLCFIVFIPDLIVILIRHVNGPLASVA